MLLVICVDRDDDLGQKAGIETPLVGRDAVEQAARDFGIVDPEDSDLNALYEGMRIYDEEVGAGTEAELVVLSGRAEEHRNHDRAIASQLDSLLEDLDAESAIVVTDGAEDERVIPIVESRLKVDGVSRTVVRQSENLENAYHVMKQVLDDPDTRATILVPAGILLLIFPIDVILSHLGFEGVALALAAAALGGYFLVKGLGLEDELDELLEETQDAIYTGKVSLITYIVAAGLVVIGAASGVRSMQMHGQGEEIITGTLPLAMAFIQGAIAWLTAAGVISSIGRIVDEYIQREDFPIAYLNGPFYIVAMGLALHGVSGYILGQIDVDYLTAILLGSVGIGAASTYVFGGIGRSSDGAVEGDEELVGEATSGEN